MFRTATFANIGTDIKGISSTEEALNAAHLNYNVVKTNMYLKGESGELIDYPDMKFTTVEGTSRVLGVVSAKYEICQNRDAFSFIDYIGRDFDGFEYVKAGETPNGIVYIIAKFPNDSILGDAFTPYIIFQNSHDGRSSIKATICPLRIICQNQFNLSFKSSPNTVRIVHSSKLDRRMLEARTVLKDVAGYMTTFKSTAESLAEKKISYDDVISVFYETFGTANMDSQQKQKLDRSRSKFLACYNSDDNQNFRGTAWGVINSAADYLTHHKISRSGPDMRFVNTTLVTSALTQIYDNVMKHT